MGLHVAICVNLYMLWSYGWVGVNHIRFELSAGPQFEKHEIHKFLEPNLQLPLQESTVG